MPLFGKKKDMTNADWVMRNVHPDPVNRKFLEDLIETDGTFTPGSKDTELFLRCLYLMLVKYKEDRLLEYMPTRETRQELTTLFYSQGYGAMAKLERLLKENIPDYELVMQAIYLDFFNGAFMDYEVRNDGIYKIPGR